MPDPALRLKALISSSLSMAMLAVLVAMAFAWVAALRRIWSGGPFLPPVAPHPEGGVPWGGRSVLAGFAAALMVSLVVSNLYQATAGGLAKGDAFDMMLVSSAVNAALLLVVPLVLRRTSGARASDFGLVPGRILADARAGLGAFLLLAPAVYAVQAIAASVLVRRQHPLETMIVQGLSARTAAVAFLSAVILAPAAEELLFRGLLQSWLSRRLGDAPPPEPDLGPEAVVEPESEPAPEPGEAVAPIPNGPDVETDSNPFAPPLADLAPPSAPGVRLLPKAPEPVLRWLPIALTSAAFASLHAAQWPAPLAIFLLSLGLGRVYRETGSLVAPFVLHASFNGLSTMALFLAVLAGPHPPSPPKPAPPTEELRAAPVAEGREGVPPEIKGNSPDISADSRTF